MNELTKLKSVWKDMRSKAAAVDIEMQRFNCEVAIVGFARLSNGEVSCNHLIAGRSLTKTKIKRELSGVRLILTYNGTKHDMAKLKSDYGIKISRSTVHIDIFKAAIEAGYSYKLVELERIFGIKREEKTSRGPIDLWKDYAHTGDEKVLRKLLTHNHYDCVNLFEIADKLVC